jgi:hypothetical protein
MVWIGSVFASRIVFVLDLPPTRAWLINPMVQPVSSYVFRHRCPGYHPDFFEQDIRQAPVNG